MTETVVIDTMIVGWLFGRRSKSLAPYRAHITGRQIVVSFVTVAESRYGALRANWGETKREAIEEHLAQMQVVRPDNDLVNTYAKMRAECAVLGHGLQQKNHEADRWIADAAIRYGLPLVSQDSIFKDVPGLVHVYEG